MPNQHSVSIRPERITVREHASDFPPAYLPFTSPRSASGLKNWLQTLLGSSKSQDKLRKPPRALQEPFKRPAAGIMRLCCNLGTISYEFSPPQRGLGTSKTIKILRAVCKFRGFAIFGSSRLSSSMSDPLWRLLGGPRSLKPVLNLILDRPRAVQECFWRAPEASKSAPSRLREPSRPPRCPSASPKRSQRPNKRPRGCSKRPPGRNFQPRGPLKRSAKRTKNTLDPSEQH